MLAVSTDEGRHEKDITQAKLLKMNTFAPDGSFSMVADTSAGKRAMNMLPNLSVPAIVS